MYTIITQKTTAFVGIPAAPKEYIKLVIMGRKYVDTVLQNW